MHYVAMGELLSPGHIMVMVILFAVFYFVPTVVAWRRKVHKRTGITVLNLLLGWTVLGWIGALIWACSAETEEQARRKEIDYDELAKAMARQDERRPPH